MIREQIILDFVKCKDVLDIGSIGQTAAYSLWNLYKTAEVKSLFGIDLLNAQTTAQEAFKLSASSFSSDPRIIYGNMENHEFKRSFDVIVAGEVIEHVSNQGLFLDNIRKHLRQEGRLILTTPNAKSAVVIFKPNPTHVLWHDRYTLRSLLDRHGFEIERLIYYPGNKEKYNLVVRIILANQSMLAICKLKDK